MKSLLIKDTTTEERRDIVRNALDFGGADCEGIDIAPAASRHHQALPSPRSKAPQIPTARYFIILLLTFCYKPKSQSDKITNFAA